MYLIIFDKENVILVFPMDHLHREIRTHTHIHLHRNTYVYTLIIGYNCLYERLQPSEKKN